jgi:hypothetical protein
MKIILISSIVANILLGFFLYKTLKKLKIVKGAHQENDGPLSTGSDLFNDLTKSKDLFRKLKREIHPDRFIGNDELHQYAQECMMELGKIEHSYTSMIILIEEMKKNNFPFSEEINNISN